MEKAVIKYSDAPTGKAYVGQYKQPFQEVKEGFGFYGVLIQDEDKELVQCHLCGKWFASLGVHVRKCGNITAREYKERFGLNYGTGLLSDALAEKRRSAYYENISKVKLSEDSWKKANPMKGKPKPSNRHEKDNRFGTCAKQLLTRTINFVHENKMLPTSRNRGKNLYSVIRRKYGSTQKAYQAWGLPTYKVRGCIYEYFFPDGVNLRFDFLRNDQRKSLYQKMMKKCPVLTAKDLDPYVVRFDDV